MNLSEKIVLQFSVILQVVIPKVALREDEEKEKALGKYSELVSEHYLQIIQLGVIVCLILFL